MRCTGIEGFLFPYLKQSIFFYIKAVTVSRRHYCKFCELIYRTYLFDLAGYTAIFSIRYPVGY
jgi:hypothetical protein